MKRGATRAKVLAYFRDQLERVGEQPTLREAGNAVGISSVMAWKHVQALIGEGKLIALGGGKVALSDATDLSGTPTEQLRDELARRGVSMDALRRPKLLANEGRPCAANFCFTRVQRGHLMCWDHWTALPAELRNAILGAFRARDVEAYQEAVEAARDHLGGFTRVAERV